jgi:hypothetical protein
MSDAKIFTAVNDDDDENDDDDGGGNKLNKRLALVLTDQLHLCPVALCLCCCSASASSTPRFCATTVSISAFS